MSAKDKWVRRFSVDETAKHKNGFTIYKITSVLFPIDSPEALTSVSVWKRYSDVQRLHKSMRALHVGLHLRGMFPTLPRYSYFKRFQQEVIEERAKTLKALLEFVAEHRLLFTSADFVNFLQTGYPEPEPQAGGVINAIRSSLHLPIEEAPPLEYQTDDDDSRSPTHIARPSEERLPISIDETDFISQIPIYEAAAIEIRESIDKKTDSFESLSSIESIDSDLYEELNKLTIKKSKPSVKKSVLPDLINFDVPSTSKFEDYHTMPVTGSADDQTMPETGCSDSRAVPVTGCNDSETVSLCSNMESASMCELRRRNSSKLSLYSKRSVLSLSNVDSKTKTEDSYVFEAGYMLNLAARCEDVGDFHRAFECYKSGIEKMLIGVQTDSDPQRRALIKEKTNRYLSYAEEIYKNHLYDGEQSLMPEQDSARALHCPIPISMLSRPYEDLSLYRVLALLGTSMMLVLHKGDNKCYAMKVIQKVPNNLTEFDEYFLQRTSETRSPILPTVIPYMVPLHAYIETHNLIFLILACAPGEKLFNYIKNYAKSVPNTPAREVNLENVFAEPKIKSLDAENNVKLTANNEKVGHSYKDNEKVGNSYTDNVKVGHSYTDNEKVGHSYVHNEKLGHNIDQEAGTSYNVKTGHNVDNDKVDNVMDNDKVDHSDCDNNKRNSVDELVLNSHKLLLDVDKVLTESFVVVDNVVDKEMNRDIVTETTSIKRITPHPREVLPPSAICKWGAEILTALESLHNSGVICRHAFGLMESDDAAKDVTCLPRRYLFTLDLKTAKLYRLGNKDADLNPSNILLGEGGQIILTYFYSYAGLDMTLSKLRRSADIDMYIAPELYVNTIIDDRDENENVCDYWSFGAVMYQLICGVPLSYYHRTLFTSHTILQLPDGMSVEEESLLTQLLTYEPSERLGGGKNGVEEIKQHPYFKNINWQYIYESWIVPD